MSTPYPPSGGPGPYGGQPNDPYGAQPNDPYGQRDPYAPPPTGDTYIPGGAPGAGNPGGYPASGGFEEPGYGQPATQAFPQQQYGQPAYNGGGGSWNEPPKKSNKQSMLIIGALIALLGIGAAVLILVLNRDDKEEAGGDGGDGTTTSETTTSAAPNPGDEMAGNWDVTSTITSLDGVSGINKQDGTTVKEGGVRWDSHIWAMTVSDCEDAESCSLAVTDQANSDVFDLELADGEWTATWDTPFPCSDESVETLTVEVTIPYEEGADELTGTMVSADNGSCGPDDNMVMEEEITLTKK